MPSSADRILFDALSVVSIFAPPFFLVWAWIRRQKHAEQSLQSSWRGRIALASLIGITLLYFGNWIAIVAVGTFGDFNSTVEMWMRWTRVHFYACLVLVLLSVIGKRGFRVPVILCSFALVWFTIVIYSLK